MDYIDLYSNNIDFPNNTLSNFSNICHFQEGNYVFAVKQLIYSSKFNNDNSCLFNIVSNIVKTDDLQSNVIYEFCHKSYENTIILYDKRKDIINIDVENLKWIQTIPLSLNHNVNIQIISADNNEISFKEGTPTYIRLIFKKILNNTNINYNMYLNYNKKIDNNEKNYEYKINPLYLSDSSTITLSKIYFNKPLKLNGRFTIAFDQTDTMGVVTYWNHRIDCDTLIQKLNINNNNTSQLLKRLAKQLQIWINTNRSYQYEKNTLTTVYDSDNGEFKIIYSPKKKYSDLTITYSNDIARFLNLINPESSAEYEVVLSTQKRTRNQTICVDDVGIPRSELFSIKTLNIYLEEIKPFQVGNSYLKLLKTIPYNCFENYTYYESKLYDEFPMSVNYLNKLHIYIRDEYGEDILFNDKTDLSLFFILKI